MQKFKVYFWKRLPNILFKDIKQKYKNRYKDYLNVYICDELEDMYKITDKLENKKVKRDYNAWTSCYSRNCYDIKSGKLLKTYPLCGNIIFNKKGFYVDAISHESTHAVIGYFSRILKENLNIFSKFDNEFNLIEENDINEELFCYMVGNIAEQIAEKSEN